jgi:hypothetical protein
VQGADHADHPLDWLEDDRRRRDLYGSRVALAGGFRRHALARFAAAGRADEHKRGQQAPSQVKRLSFMSDVHAILCLQAR